MDIAGRMAPAQRWFWVLLAGSVLLRLAGLALDAEPRFFLGDSHSYLSTRPGQWMPPDRSWSYGLALWLLFELTHRLAAALALQCVLTALMIALVGWTVLRAGLPPWAGALLLLALHADPMLFFYERALLTETAGTTALIAGIVLSLAALRSGSTPAALAAAGFLVLGVSLRTVFLPPVLWTAAFTGAIGACSGRAARHLPPRKGARTAGLALAGATVAGLAAYALVTGHLTGRRPAINPNGGFMLAGAVAPLLEPVDFTGLEPDDARALLAGSRNREWHLRNAQIYGTGLIVDRLRRSLGSEQAAADAALAAARAAIRRDPAGFARQVRRQTAEYLDLTLSRERLPYWAGLDRTLPDALLADLRRRVVDAPSAESPAHPSPALAYLKRSATYLPLLAWLAIAVTLGSLALLPRVPRGLRPGLALSAGALLAYLGGVFAFSAELGPRYLYPLVPLIALDLGLLLGGRRRADEHQETHGSPQ